MSSDGEATVDDEVCASCDKVEVDDKAQDHQEELKKKCDDACDDYSNAIIIENDTSPPQEHDIVVEAFAVPEDDVVIEAAEQGENNNNNNNNGGTTGNAEVQPSSSDNLPSAQVAPTICGIDKKRFKQNVCIGYAITWFVVLFVSVLFGEGRNNDGMPGFIAFGTMLLLWIPIMILWL